MRHRTKSRRDVSICYYFFQNGGRSPSWICYVRVSLVTTSIWWYLTLCDGIDTVVSIICKC